MVCSQENKVKPLWRPLWLRQPSWCRTSPTQTYLLANEGNCGKQILRPRLFTLGDIVPYLYLYIALICYLFALVILFCILGRSLRSHGRILRPIFSAVHHLGYHTCCIKVSPFIVLSHLKLNKYKICSIPIHPPLGIL